MSIPVTRLLIGGCVAAAVMFVGLALVGRHGLGGWADYLLPLLGAFALALFAPAYFGIDRDSHRRGQR